MHNSSWDNLRYVLAVADMGSVNRAARHLGVNHATVLRHIADYEARHGTAIFERSARGYRVLADKRDVITAARAASDAVELAGQRAAGSAVSLKGKVRITTTDTLGQALLPEVLADLQARQRQLTFELLCTNAHVDLERLNIDIAVRPAPRLADDLEGQVVAQLGFAVFASSSRPEGWFGLAGPLARSVAAEWMSAHVDPSEIVGTSDSFMILAGLAAHGQARVILPGFVGAATPGLVHLPDAMPPLSVPLWVASPPALAGHPRVRSVAAALSRGFSDRKALLEVGSKS